MSQVLQSAQIDAALAVVLARSIFGDTARVKEVTSASDPATRFRIAYVPQGGAAPVVVGYGESGFGEAIQKSLISQPGRDAQVAVSSQSPKEARYQLDANGHVSAVYLYHDSKRYEIEMPAGYSHPDSSLDFITWNTNANPASPSDYIIPNAAKENKNVQAEVIAQQSAPAAQQKVKVAIPKAYVNPSSVKTGLMGWDEDVTPAAILAAITGEHLLVVGPPGAAKSLFTRRFFANFEGSKFETQLSKYADETALFGAPNLKRLREDGVFEYPKHGIAAADFAFIDEIFDASDVLLRTLLGILQEKKFTKGGHEEDIPLQSVIATANYTRVNEITGAVVDRFAFAVSSPVLNDAQIARLYSNESFEEIPVARNVVSIDQLKQMRAAAKAVIIPDSIITAMVSWGNEMGFTPRRHRKLAGIVRASAALGGRKKVDENDIMAARFCVPVSNSGKVEDAKKSLQPLKDAILQSLHEGEQLAALGKLAQLPPMPDVNNAGAVIAAMKAAKAHLITLRGYNCVSEKVNQKREAAVTQYDAFITNLHSTLGL